MPLQVRKKERETSSALLYRFTKRVKRSGILKEARTRRFRNRDINRSKRRFSALHRARKKQKVEQMKKLGLL